MPALAARAPLAAVRRPPVVGLVWPGARSSSSSSSGRARRRSAAIRGGSTTFLGAGSTIEHRPPFSGPDRQRPRRCPTSGRSSGRSPRPSQRERAADLAESSLGAALFTCRRRSRVRSSAAPRARARRSCFVHSRLAERAFVPLRRGEPDDPDPRHRAAHRRRPSKAGWLGDRDRRRVPDVLPGDDRRAARPARGRPARLRADAVATPPARWTVLWKLRLPASRAVPVHGAQGRGDGVGRRRDRRRAARPASARASAARILNCNAVLHARARSGCGPRSSSRAAPRASRSSLRRPARRALRAPRAATDRVDGAEPGAMTRPAAGSRPGPVVALARRQQGVRGGGGPASQALERHRPDDRRAASSSR